MQGMNLQRTKEPDKVETVKDRAGRTASGLVDSYVVLRKQNLFAKLWLFFWRFFRDVVKNKDTTTYKGYGLTAYVGRQGSGKSISMVEELEYIRQNYPKVKIMTNFGYIHEDEALTDWQQLIDCRNAEGIVFAIDEIQNEFDVYDARSFNLDILKVITQQRKQGIKIIASSQVFTRVSKPLREQCFEVVECTTLAGRWTFQKAFDADDYNYIIDSTDIEKKHKARRLWRRNFVQSDDLRRLYDSYRVIDSMTKLVKQNKKNGVYS